MTTEEVIQQLPNEQQAIIVNAAWGRYLHYLDGCYDADHRENKMNIISFIHWLKFGYV